MILMKNSMRGVSVLGALFMAVVLVFAVLILMRLIPPYFDFSEVKDSVDLLAKDPKTSKMSKPQLREMFSRRLHVNNINNVDPSKLEVTNDKGKRTLSITYETRVHLMGNVDAVLTFQTQAEASE
jgi:hypothetical protein